MRDLNPRHPAPKAGALPNCANARLLVYSNTNDPSCQMAASVASCIYELPIYP